jgi:hypothetical protein
MPCQKQALRSSISGAMMVAPPTLNLFSETVP